MRKLSASYIFPLTNAPVKNGILLLDNDGTVGGLIGPDTTDYADGKVEYYKGIIMPGFVNAHCHLELSHLRGKIDRGLGLGGFIGEINKLRNSIPEDVEKAIIEGDKELYLQGTSVVGDISNTILSLNVKRSSQIHYHTFAESFGFLPSRAERAFELALKVYEDFKSNNIPASIVPHSPYSVSESLFQKIISHCRQNKTILTIHNQESEGENQFFRDGTGPVANHLRNNIGLDISGWKPTGKNSLESVLNFIPSENQLILVHNTFSTEHDLRFLKQMRQMENTYLCLCPNSNLYIENCLPDITLFRKEKMNICLGTDSLASNQDLSILSEIITIQTHFPEIALDELFTWACLNGARALGVENRFGSFETGKQPGVILISGIDLSNLRLKPSCRIQRLA